MKLELQDPTEREFNDITRFDSLNNGIISVGVSHSDGEHKINYIDINQAKQIISFLQTIIASYEE